MKMRIFGIALLSGMLAITGCSGGNDNGEEGSVIGLGEEGAGDGSDGDAGGGEDETPVVLAFGSGNGDTFADGQLGTAQATLSAGGQTTISASVVNNADSNQLVVQPNTVTFTSVCTQLGTASITERVSSSNGSFSAIYTAAGCEGIDTITATLEQSDGLSLQASGIVTVASSNPGGIQFESIDNPVLSINRFGSSSRPESTKVRFRVVDRQDLPVRGVDVAFSLSNTIGGTTLLADSAEVDSQGFAIATLIAGRVNTTVSVTAEITSGEAEGISTTSDPISISTGLPDQNSFSLAASDLAPWSADREGTEVEVTIRAADAYNNPVRDGTIVNFRTESGSIEPTCSTVGGACTVIWVSQDPRPDSIDVESVITAYTEGEEYLQADLNANGLMDIGEPFEPLPEVFEDINGDNRYDTTAGLNGFDEYIDFNENGVYDKENNLFDGLRCSEAAIAAGHCANTIQVRDSVFLCIAGGIPEFTNEFADDNSYKFTLTDQYGNSLPSGTVISVGVENGEITGGVTEFGPFETQAFAKGGNDRCNDGYTDTITVVKDPDATDDVKINITVTTGQSGATIMRTVTFPNA